MTEEARDAVSAKSASAANSLANWIKVLLGTFGLAVVWLIIWGAKLDSTVTDTKARLNTLSVELNQMQEQVRYLTIMFCRTQGWDECPRLQIGAISP